MPEHERSIAEEFRIVANQYVEAMAVLDTYEELKTTRLEQFKSDLIKELGDMADNKAERLVKSGTKWEEYLNGLLASKKAAHKLRLQLEWIRIKERVEDRMSWLQRTEHKMGRSTT